MYMAAMGGYSVTYVTDIWAAIDTCVYGCFDTQYSTVLNFTHGAMCMVYWVNIQLHM